LTDNYLPAKEISMFELKFEPAKKAWTLWKGGQEYRVPKEVIHFHEIFIPTSDSIRHHSIL
jgi:hypothetical protein